MQTLNRVYCGCGRMIFMWMYQAVYFVYQMKQFFCFSRDVHAQSGFNQVYATTHKHTSGIITWTTWSRTIWLSITFMNDYCSMLCVSSIRLILIKCRQIDTTTTIVSPALLPTRGHSYLQVMQSALVYKLITSLDSIMLRMSLQQELIELCSICIVSMTKRSEIGGCKHGPGSKLP